MRLSADDSWRRLESPDRAGGGWSILSLVFAPFFEAHGGMLLKLLGIE